MKIFFDSSFLIAYANNNDSLHEKAINLRKKGIYNNECYISNYVINEVITVLGNKKGLELAKETYYILKDNFKILNENEISNFYDKVMTTYEKYDAKLSFTDTSIIEMMKENNINVLVSFDKYFDKVNGIIRKH